MNQNLKIRGHFYHEDRCLTIRRVNSHENGTQIGFEQLKEVATNTVFKNQLCVNVADSAYSNRRMRKTSGG